MKNFMKKFCSFALSIAMLLSSLAPAAIAEDDNHFVEMNDTELVSPFSVIGKLTVYSEPDANSLVLGSYSAEELNITDSNAFGWIRVSISGIEGYVYISAPQSVAENIQRSDNENESIESTVTGNATLLEADNVATDTETEAPTLENVKDEQDELDLVNNEDDGADETSKPVDTVVEQTDNLEESGISTGNHEESDPDLPIVEDGEVSTNEDIVSVSEDDEPGQETTCVDENEKQTGDAEDSTIPDENPGKSDIEFQVSEDEEEEENVGEENGLVIEDDELEQKTTPEDEAPEQAGNVEESTIPAEDPEESDIEFWVGEDEDQDENIGEGNGLVIEDDELEQVTTPVDEVPEQTGNVEESTIPAEDLEESDIEFQVGEDKDKEESSSEENEFVFADDEPGQEIAPVVDEATEQTKDEENSGIPADEPDESNIDSWLVVDEDEEENTSDGNELVIEDDEPGQEIAPVDEALEQTGDVENSCVPADESDIDSWLVVDEDEEEIASEENDIVIEDDEPEQETMPVDEATEQTDDMENSGIFTDEHEESDLDFLVIDDETEEEGDKDSDLTTELMVEKSDNTTSGFETVLLDVYPLETSEKPVREPDTGLLMASGIGFQPNMGIKLMSVNIDTETDNHVMGIHVDNIIVGNSFGISWDSVKYADHYEIAVVRIDADGQETYVTSGTSHRKNTGSSCSYTVSASDVPDDTVRFRIYVGAASTGYPCDSSNMIKDNTVTITARYAKNQDMDVTISVDEDGGYVYWSKVSNTDYYIYSVYDITDSQYIYNRAETTSKSFDIDSADVISGHKYRVWVGAYDASDTLLAQHQAEVILQVNCPHDVTMKKDLYGYYEEDEITDKYHTLYNVYNVVCKSCGKVLKENQVESLGEEEHEYSTEGVCIFCHYAGGECLHVDTSKVYTRTEYEPEDEDTHTMIKHFDVVCDYCEAVIPLRLDELYSRDRTERTEGLSHSFKNGTCEKCGYIKAPELTITLQRGQSSAEVGEAISANASIAGGSGTYQVIWKVYCDNVCVNDDVTGAWISGIEHSASYSASRAGTWYFEATVYDSADTANYVTAKTQTIIVTEPTCDHEYETIDQTELTEYENVNDSQHRIIYHHASVCSICKDVKSTWTSDAFEAHKFDNSGKCVCGAVKETDPDCVHEWNSTVKEIKVEQTTMNDRMEKHKVTTVYSDYCSKCGSEDSHEVVEYVAHVFDKNGYCECGYVEVTDECDHATTGIPEGDAVYEVINNSVHSVTTYERHKCACGQVNELRETTVQMPHTFVDGFCVCGLDDPGPACPHLTTDVTWDTKYSVTYKSISDTEHSMSGYMYEYCTECLERIGESYAVTKNYKHTFDDAGDCIDCDYRAGCQHTETIKKYEDTTYASIDEKYHKVTDFYSLVCADCGKVLVALDSSLKVTSEEEHQFDGNACTLCDYVKADALTVSVVAGQDTASAGETISAKATIAGGSGSYSIAWAVMLDGEEIYQTDMSKGNLYSYVADKAGSYVFTVNVKDSAGNIQTASSSVIVVTVTHNWKTVTSTEFINQSDKYHDIVTTTYEECTICGEKTQPVVTTQSVEHVIVRTGYEVAHPHQKFSVCRDCSAHPLLEGSYQTANGKVQTADKCCICHGHVWLTNEPDEVNGEQAVYCVNCGQSKTVDKPVIDDCQHAEGYINSRDINESPVYTNINDPYYHMVYSKAYTEAECATCGETRQMNISMSNQREAHVFNDKSVCDLCGYVSLSGSYDAQDRYDVYISTNYYTNDKSMVYVGIGSPVTIMLYDKFEGKHVHAANADVTITLNDPNGIASFDNRDVVVANNSGTFSVTVTYLGQTIGTINLGATLLSVDDDSFWYQIESGVVRLEDLDKIDWDSKNVLLTTTTSMGEFNSVSNKDGRQTVTFNAYNSSAAVVGIAVFDANGKQVGTTKMVKPYWGTGSFIENAYRTFSATERIWDSKSFNGVETQITKITLDVPAGGFIQVVQMNEDSNVYAANIAEMVLGGIKLYNDAESLINPVNLKEIETLIEKLGKDEYYEIVRNYLIRTYGANFDDLTYVAKQEAGKALLEFVAAKGAGEAFDGDRFAEVLISEMGNIITEVLSYIPEAVGSTLLEKGEDGILFALDPFLYYLKHSVQSIIDDLGMTELIDAYNECMNNGTDTIYISHIIAPQKEKYVPSTDANDALVVNKRNVVTLNSCDLRGAADQNYQYFITIPQNTVLELVGSMTGNDGEIYYEVLYNGTRGYIPANEADVQ